MFRKNVLKYEDLNQDNFIFEDKRENGAGRFYLIRKKDRRTKTVAEVLKNKNKGKNNTNPVDDFNDLLEKYYINLCINSKNYLYVEFIKR